MQCFGVKLLISPLCVMKHAHDLVHEFSHSTVQCLACRPSYKALLHVGTQQERVDKPWFDQLLVVGCLDAVWTPCCQPPQGSLETQTYTNISVCMCTNPKNTQTYALSHIKSMLCCCMQTHALKSCNCICSTQLGRQKCNCARLIWLNKKTNLYVSAGLQ